MPHLPQCFSLVLGFTHFPSQHIFPKLHFFPHLPQLSLSVENFTHLLLQQSGPALPLARHIFGFFSHVNATLWERNRLVPRRDFGSSFESADVADIAVMAKAINKATRKRVLNNFIIENEVMWWRWML